jgi:hypothetical protein
MKKNKVVLSKHEELHMTIVSLIVSVKLAFVDGYTAKKEDNWGTALYKSKTNESLVSSLALLSVADFRKAIHNIKKHKIVAEEFYPVFDQFFEAVEEYDKKIHEAKSLHWD